jgi:hypothetical protein
MTNHYSLVVLNACEEINNQYRLENFPISMGLIKRLQTEKSRKQKRNKSHMEDDKRARKVTRYYMII